MSKYQIYLEAWVSEIVEVEADSFDEACDLAYDDTSIHPSAGDRYDVDDIGHKVQHCTVDGESIVAEVES